MTAEQTVLICQQELECLNGTGPLATSVYLWLRSWADWQTGVVGISRRISLQMIATYCEQHIPKGAGTQILRPTEKDVRMAVQALVRAELVSRKRTEKLVFLLPKAPTAQDRPKQTGRVLGTVLEPELGTEPGANRAGVSPLYDAGFSQPDSPEPGTEPGANRAGRKSPNRAHFSNQSKPSTLTTVVTPLTTVVDCPEPKSSESGLAEKADPLAKVIGIDPAAVAVARVLSEAMGARFNAMHPEVMRIAELHPTPEQVDKAVARARGIRASEGSIQPLNLAFVRSNLSAVMLEGRVRAPFGWGSDQAVAQQYARQLGLPHPEGLVGESFETFKLRIGAFVRAAAQSREQA